MNEMAKLLTRGYVLEDLGVLIEHLRSEMDDGCASEALMYDLMVLTKAAEKIEADIGYARVKEGYEEV